MKPTERKYKDYEWFMMHHAGEWRWSIRPLSAPMWTLDPQEKFPHLSEEQIIQSLGLIPQFLDCTEPDVVDTALLRYGFNLGGAMGGGIVSPEGTYSFPEDPDLYPLAKCHVNDKTVYVYQYGMISFVDDATGEAVTYRFD